MTRMPELGNPIENLHNGTINYLVGLHLRGGVDNPPPSIRRA
jgi:hypothetical protein